MTTRDGFTWTPEGGLKPGLPCKGAINPPEKNLPENGEVSDVIVLGAGYAGLVAARDLSTQG
jgi:NADPH-dependent 2,4-dienoyl-CoA reductase/sulfur reductase-like enzyme